MTMSVNNCLDPRELGRQPLLQGVGRATLSWMVDADVEISCLYCINSWQFLPYIWPVNIAVDTSERPDLAQRVQEPLAREIPCVNDHICARQVLNDLSGQVVD